MPNDKPAIVARDAQQAAAAAQQAADAISAIPGSSPAKNTVLKVLGAVATVGGAVATGLTMGTPAGWIVAGVGVVSYFAGLFHPSPQAIATYGSSAK